MPTRKQILQVQAEQLILNLTKPTPKYKKGSAKVEGENQPEIIMTFRDGRKIPISPSNPQLLTPEMWNDILNNSKINCKISTTLSKAKN